ncbi:MAG: hypothetical protein AAFN30_03740 [Actinomycetota bacterium]
MRVRDDDRPATGRKAANGVRSTVFGGLLLVAAAVGELALSDRPLSAEWPPATGAGYLLRSLLLALASLALVFGARRVVTATLPVRVPDPLERPTAPLVVALGMVPAIVAAVLLLVDPAALSRMVREDGPIEWASAGLAFAAGGLYAAAAVSHVRRRGPTNPLTIGALVVAAGIALLLGLEEISWFQRVFDVESPEFMLNRNGQQELNLHNLATGFSGNAYFVGGFAVCCALPFFLGDRRLPARLEPLQPLIPSRLVLLAAATSTAVVYEMWNIVWIQLTFWLTMAMLVTMATTASTSVTRTLAWSVLGVSLVVAVVFLVGGDAMVRSWDDTEVREVIVPYGLVLAGYESMRRAGRDHPMR